MSIHRYPHENPIMVGFCYRSWDYSITHSCSGVPPDTASLNTVMSACGAAQFHVLS